MVYRWINIATFKHRIILEAKFSSLLWKVLEKANKNNWETRWKKQVQALKFLESYSKESPSIKKLFERMLNPEIMNELESIKEQKQKIDLTYMLYRRYKTMYDFAKFEIIQRFGDDIRIVIITLDMTNNKQQQLAKKLEHLSVIQDQKMSTWLKKIRASTILHWHLSMKDKWSSMLL